jgi:hypothetical protein
MPLRPMLVADAWNRIDRAAAGVPGAEVLQSFFIGQVVGAFSELGRAEDVALRILRTVPVGSTSSPSWLRADSADGRAGHRNWWARRPPVLPNTASGAFTGPNG